MIIYNNQLILMILIILIVIDLIFFFFFSFIEFLIYKKICTGPEVTRAIPHLPVNLAMASAAYTAVTYNF